MLLSYYRKSKLSFTESEFSRFVSYFSFFIIIVYELAVNSKLKIIE